MRLVRRYTILTKFNLSRRGWNGDANCVLYGAVETTEHLFSICLVSKTIWDWVAHYNNFVFNCSTLKDLWCIDSQIPLKDIHCVKIIRSAVL